MLPGRKNTSPPEACKVPPGFAIIMPWRLALCRNPFLLCLPDTPLGKKRRHNPLRRAAHPRASGGWAVF